MQKDPEDEIFFEDKMSDKPLTQIFVVVVALHAIAIGAMLLFRLFQG